MSIITFFSMLWTAAYVISMFQLNKLICCGLSNLGVCFFSQQKSGSHISMDTENTQLKKGNVWVNESMTEQGGGAGKENCGDAEVGRVWKTSCDWGRRSISSLLPTARVTFQAALQRASTSHLTLCCAWTSPQWASEDPTCSRYLLPTAPWPALHPNTVP